MEDRELFEMAAKAIGIRIKLTKSKVEEGKLFCLRINGGETKPWNPLDHDGDALRLAVKLRLSISAANPAFIEVAIFKDGEAHLLFRDGTTDSGWNEDSYAATRRAITRAAAEIGKTMENQNV
jgi:hypothetical protein